MRANAPGWSWPSLWYGTPFPSWTAHRPKSRQAIGRCPNEIGSVCHDGTQNPGGRRRQSHGGCCLSDCFQTRAALQVEPRPALSVWKARDSRWTVDLFEDGQTLHWQTTSQGFCKLDLFDRKGPLAETALVERSVGRNVPRPLVLAVKGSLRRPSNRAFQQTPLSKEGTAQDGNGPDRRQSGPTFPCHRHSRKNIGRRTTGR